MNKQDAEAILHFVTEVRELVQEATYEQKRNDKHAPPNHSKERDNGCRKRTNSGATVEAMEGN